MNEFDRAAVITIQGGGVYGLNLLGQLQYVVDQLHVTPLALAGTSAGSIVATLYWAGLRPKEIRDRFTSLADDDGLINLLGPFGEGENQFNYDEFCELTRRISDYIAMARQSIGDGISVWTCLSHPVRTASALNLARREMSEIMRHATRRGFFVGQELELKIDKWIRSSDRLAPYAKHLPTTRLLQFGDFTRLINEHGLRLPALFLTATNLTNRSLELFNSIDARYCNVPVARAVRASAGFPVFFRAIEIQQLAEPGWFCDGGVISNFPAWVFSDGLRQKLAMSDMYAGVASRPWLHIGLRLVSDPEPQHHIELTPQEQIAAFVELLSGQARSELENVLTPLVARTVLVNQPMSTTSGPDNLLAVNQLSREMMITMIQAGVDQAEKVFQNVSFNLPRTEDVEPILSRLLQKSLLVLGGDSEKLKLRSNIFVIQRDSLHLRYATNMKGDPDEHMVFGFTSGLTGLCFTRRAPLICNLAKIRELAEAGHLRPEQLFNMTPEQQRNVRRDRTWLASVPIFDSFAVYPRDMAKPSASPLVAAAPHAHSLSSPIDGAVIGVLNLDSAMEFGDLGMSSDPAQHFSDVRIEAIINLMQATAAEIGTILSNGFASQEALYARN